MNTQTMVPSQEQNKIQGLLRKVGGQNKYQYFLFLIFALKWIVAAMILFSLNFFYYVPPFSCQPWEMADYDTCESFVCSYDSQFFWYLHLKQPLKKSIALDYGVIMVCSKAWLSSLLQSISYIGSLFGYLIMSHIADNYGRKKGQLIAWIICMCGAITTILSVNLAMIGIGSFLLGFGANGAINIHYSFFKQLVLGKTRSRMIIAIQLAFSIGISLISLLSYFINDWKYTMGFFILVPSIIAAILMFKFVEETTQFTLRIGLNHFVQSFNRIAKFNNKDLLEVEAVKEELANYSNSEQWTNVSYLDLFRYKSLRTIAITTGLINFTIQFIYDGTLLSLDKFGLNVYFNQILVGLVEVFAALFATFMVPKVRRKRYVTIALIIITVVCICMGIEALTYNHITDEINYHTIIEMILIAALRFLMSSLWGVFFVYLSELYPNEVSSLSYGWVSITGTIGASLSPYIRLFTANLTMFIMGVMAGLMIIVVRPLQETKGKAIRIRIKERQEEAVQAEKYQVVSIN